MECEYNLNYIFKEILLNRVSAINWRQKVGLLPKWGKCSNCHEKILKITNSIGIGQFRCRKRECNTKISIAANTWFYNLKLTMDQLIIFSYLFAHGIYTCDTIRKECKQVSDTKNMSNKTIASKY